jgi:hypothetical protein
MYDDSFTNKSWEVVAEGRFTLLEINQMEREMCGYLGWQLSVDGLALQDFEIFVTTHFSKEQVSYPVYAPFSTASTRAIDPSMAAYTTTPRIPDNGAYTTSPYALDSGSGKGGQPTSFIRDSVVGPRQGLASTIITHLARYPMKDEADGPTLRSTHIEEVPPTHPLQSQMFAFAVPSNF